MVAATPRWISASRTSTVSLSSFELNTLRIGITSPQGNDAQSSRSTRALQAQRGEPWMVVGASAERPMEFALARRDRQVIDARDAALHEPAIVELPVLVAVGAIPLAAIVTPFIRKPNGNAVAVTRPKLFDEPIVDFLGPFAGQEVPYRFAAGQELGAVAPDAIGRVGERDALRISRVPGVFRRAYFLRRGLDRERREGRSRLLDGWHLRPSSAKRL